MSNSPLEVNKNFQVSAADIFFGNKQKVGIIQDK